MAAMTLIGQIRTFELRPDDEQFESGLAGYFTFAKCFRCLSTEAAAVGARRHAERFFKRPAKCFGAPEAYRGAHGLDGVLALAQAASCFIQPQRFDEDTGSHTEHFLEPATKMARTEVGPAGESFYRQVLLQVSTCPSDQDRKSVV